MPILLPSLESPLFLTMSSIHRLLDALLMISNVEHSGSPQDLQGLTQYYRAVDNCLLSLSPPGALGSELENQQYHAF